MPRSLDAQPSPVAVIGAGPVGLAAAAHLLASGEEPIVFEAGPIGRDEHPGLGPRPPLLALALRRRRGRRGAARSGRAGAPRNPKRLPDRPAIWSSTTWRRWPPMPRCASRIRLDAPGGRGHPRRLRQDEDRRPGGGAVPPDRPWTGRRGGPFLAKAVIDASGTYATPNPLGAGGVAGDRRASAAATASSTASPTSSAPQRARYAGKRVLVVGSGHSAFNVLLDLVDLADEAPGTAITWAVRRPANRLRNLFGGGIDDALPARGELGARVRRLVEAGRLRLVTGFRVARLTETAEGIVVAGEDEVLPPVDEIIAATGFRPDLSHPVRAAARTRSRRREPDRARPADRSQRPLLRHRCRRTARRSCGTRSPTSTSSA